LRNIDDRRPLVDEHPLERTDVVVPAAPDRLRRQLAHPHRHDVLVVRAVEHPDPPSRRECRVDAPQVVVLDLRPGRHAERSELQADRVDAGEDAADDAVLPRGVESLQDQEDAAPVLGVEAVLEHVDPLVELSEPPLPLGLLQAEAIGRVTRGDCRG
jgi:hypothetical protein